MSRNRRPSAGFTLVELLVVIAIIGVLVALLLPAVQAAREAARRMSCANKEKQIGLALHNHHDVHNTFPAGYLWDSNNPDDGGWGWPVLIMPYMEQTPLYEELDIENQTMPESPTAQTKRVLEAYLCPSDDSAGMGNFNNRRNGHAKSNYLGNMGVANSINTAHHDVFPNRTTPQDSSGKKFYAKGLFFSTKQPNNATKIRDITDGTSSTFAIGERAWSGSSGSGYAGGIWAGAYLANKAAGVVSACNNTDRMLNGTNDFAFASTHPGGVQFTLADASTRFVSETIDGDVYEALATRNGQETIGGDY